MATGVYNKFMHLLGTSSGGQEVVLPDSTFECLLYTTDYIDISDREDQDFVLDATSSESLAHFELSSAGGSGYARQTLGARTITEVDARNAIEVDSADITFSSVSSSAGTAGGMAIYFEFAASDSSGRYAASFYDFSSPVTPNGGDITVNLSTGGWLELLQSTSDAS